MRILAVGVWQPNCEGDLRSRGLPPLTVMHIAGLCPPHVDVQVWHEQARPLVPDAVDADLVVLGGPHVTLLPHEAAQHADAVVTGEGDRVFPQLIEDFERGRMRPRYDGGNLDSLAGLPTPRYDLLESDSPLRCYVQATRGCPWQCNFCTLKAFDQGFRVRPVDDVIRDIESCEGRTFLQRKFVWFWDDNLIGNRPYARELFRRMRPLRRWWWSQVSIDKHQNKATRYREAIEAFHRHGIAVHAGLIVGLDGDTPELIREVAEFVNGLGIDLPFVNILTPFPKTPLYATLEGERRLLGRPWEEHNAVSVVYQPAQMSPAALESAYWDVRHQLHSVPRTARRALRGLRQLNLSARMLTTYVDAPCSIGDLLHPDGPHTVLRGARPSLGAWEPASLSRT